ncbi:hypothetical protein ElyMa_000190100 [Elysia marginata]|uniref:Caveolin n=1 Tax=Elysia marginata TaxID=1093978 RepID=A0AAV4EW41_9GAST|nr:hypothetical protein ElyMa_000190100 [Elysia marginata]
MQLENTPCEKDLGEYVDPSLKVSKHCEKIASKINRIVGLIKKSFGSIDKPMPMSLFKSLVRSHLDCGCAFNFDQTSDQDVCYVDEVELSGSLKISSEFLLQTQLWNWDSAAGHVPLSSGHQLLQYLSISSIRVVFIIPVMVIALAFCIFTTLECWYLLLSPFCVAICHNWPDSSSADSVENSPDSVENAAVWLSAP